MPRYIKILIGSDSRESLSILYKKGESRATHLTMEYPATEEGIAKIKELKFPLKLLAYTYYSNNEVGAVIVSGVTRFDKKVPHVTIWTDNVPPVTANILFDNVDEYFKKNIYIPIVGIGYEIVDK